MQNLLAPVQEKKLFDFLSTEPLIAFDYDGTLAPIVLDARRAGLRPRTRQLLKTLCKLYPCALMTGRSRSDVLRLVKGIPFVQVLGNHGAEWGDEGLAPEGTMDPAGIRSMVERVAQWRSRLEQALSDVQGVTIEDKRLSLTVHYRGAKRKWVAQRRIEAAVQGLDGMRIIGGKLVYNVLPREIGGKGESLVALKRIYGKRTALFAGDDLNDEEVFVLPPREGVFKVRVGKSERSRADFFLPAQEDMDRLIETLIHVARLKRRTSLEVVSAARATRSRKRATGAPARKPARAERSDAGASSVA